MHLAEPEATLLWNLAIDVLRSRLQLNKELVALGSEQRNARVAGGISLIKSRLMMRLSLYLFRVLHLVLTAVVWQHFFYIKFKQQEAAVPDEAPNWGLKRFTPPFEFGAMHAILFQLAIIPVTMCRSLLAWLSTSSPLRGRFPFEHMVQVHPCSAYFGIPLVPQGRARAKHVDLM